MRRATWSRHAPVISTRFQSTLSMRRATHITRGNTWLLIVFQSTLSMRRATHFHTAGTLQVSISIHALHEESDLNLVFGVHFAYISIHALHEESDFERIDKTLDDLEFQSTLSMRRATQYAQQSADWGYQFQSTLSMRRATLQYTPKPTITGYFNPRSP